MTQVFQILSGPWFVRSDPSDGTVPGAVAGKTIPASVPGSIHTDLLAAHLIPDPFVEQNETQLTWIGRTHWVYTTEFVADDELLSRPIQELVFQGLDTITEVRLNGVLLGTTNNMHHPWRFDVSKHLRRGNSQKNELEILFQSNERAAIDEAERLGDLPRVLRLPFNFIRKMASNFSWDWGPEVVTCGIWRPARLEGHFGLRIENVRPLVKEANAWKALVDVHVDGIGLDDAEVRVVISDPDGLAVADSSGVATNKLTLSVDKPRLWWPRSHGSQPLYTVDLTVEARLPDGRVALSRWQGHIGLRQVRLDTSESLDGHGFTLVVNDTRIFARGANWITDDCFPARLTPEKYRRRLQQAVNANMNMLRVWGGGIYEHSAFYSLCDEMGILIWQDFMFACALYPEEHPFPRLIDTEARAAVARLACHPSIVLWNGNNENLWLYKSRVDESGRRWDQIVGKRGWGERFYLDILPKIVAELDPSRPYWAGSPWSLSWDFFPNDPLHGNTHEWDPWNTCDYTAHYLRQPRFVSEYGHGGPATFATWVGALASPADRQPGAKALLFHHRARNGDAKLRTRTAEHFDLDRVEANFDDWLYVTQLNQARAIRLAAGWHRALRPRCMGTLVWQLNDCWPATSWAAVDSAGRLKPLWFELRRMYADRYVTIQPEDEREGSLLWLHADNETDSTWTTKLSIRRVSFDGAVRAQIELELSIEARDKVSLKLDDAVTKSNDPTAELLLVDDNTGHAKRAIWAYARDKASRYPAAKWTASVVTADASGTTHDVTVTAHTLLRDLAIFPDRLSPDAEVDDQLVTLLPGEYVTFRVSGVPAHRTEELTQPPVLRCANPFGLEM